MQNIHGEEIGSLVNEYQTVGHHHATFNMTTLPRGLYFYRLVAEARTMVGKKCVLK